MMDNNSENMSKRNSLKTYEEIKNALNESKNSNKSKFS